MITKISTNTLIGIFSFLLFSCSNQSIKSIDQDLDGIIGQLEYDHIRLQSPDGKIPSNIRKRELAFAAKQNTVSASSRAIGDYTWKHRGPINIGGRTRALAQDITNPDVLIAGGASGGLWRSIDKGASWTHVIDLTEQYGISCLVQDTRSGKEHIWYYGTGEGLGNSASDYAAYYLGNGMYTSSDSGKTWTHIASTENRNLSALSSNWDLVNQIAINTANTEETELYAAVYGGLMRSVDAGQNWELVLNGDGFLASNMHSDIKIKSDGTKFAYVSSEVSNEHTGFFTSVTGELDDWTEITPEFGTHSTERMILEIDETNNVLYAFGNAGRQGHVYVSPWHEEDTSYCSFWKYDIANDEWTDMSSNLPPASKLFDGLTIQGGFDLVCRVHPDNSDHIFLGGTNLFISKDGASSKNNWTQIGGYREDAQRGTLEYRYPNHHPDQHHLIFDKSNNKSIFTAHDGGVSITDNYELEHVEWTFLTHGYYTTQCHAVTINEATSDPIIYAGLQDNGTMRTGFNDIEAIWKAALLGDGSYGAVSSDGSQVYLSSQNGNVRNVGLAEDGSLVTRSRVDPEGKKNVLFINPFVIDPNDDEILYYLGGQKLYRQNNLSQFDESVNQFDEVPLSAGWDIYSDSVDGSSGVLLTTLKATRGMDRRLYVGALGKVFRIDNPHTGDPEWQDVSVGLPRGGYVTDIAIDPRNADKFAVVISNYKTYSIFYTTDAGLTYSKVAGNLEERDSGGGDGPSCRTMVIHPLNDGKTAYIVGTSTGLYATDSMIADATFWTAVAPNNIGTVVVEMIKARQTDHTLVIGTHGAGVFSAVIDEYWKLTGVEELKETNKISVSLFPNPCSDQVFIDVKQRLESIIVYDQLGRVVINKNYTTYQVQEQLNISNLNKGIYFVEVKTSGGKSKETLIKD